MANDDSSLAHHLLLPFAAGCPDIDDEDAGPATVAFPSFWPPFPPLSPDSDSDALGFVPPRTDRETTAAASAFLGLGFHDADDEWAPPDEGGGEVELPLCWDCLQLEDHDDHQLSLSLSLRWDAEEWEQVPGTGREDDEEEAASAVTRGLGWEVLLATNRPGSLPVDDGGIDTYFLDFDFEEADNDDVLFAQLAADAEHQAPPSNKGARPAAKAAVEALPAVVVDAATHGESLPCAVCKDGFDNGGERARRLPCAHLYHDGCILPWLAIRNTCPLCRHELPTDDPEYERWKQARRGGDDDAGLRRLRSAAAGNTIVTSAGYYLDDEWIGAGGTDH